jgi:tetratricopeptide (TPR) repeat protein
MASFVDAISSNPNLKYFRVRDSKADHPRDWELEPLQTELLTDEEGDSFNVIKALNVLPNGTIRECHIDISLPERITDYAYFLENGALRYGYHHEFPGEIIAAAALDCFGVYELFYSRKRPELGIDVLRRGLAIAKRKYIIAADLGYILRDERRFAEAVEMFKIAVEEGPSSSFIYYELAGAYAELGASENAKQYSEMFNQAERDSGMIPADLSGFASAIEAPSHPFGRTLIERVRVAVAEVAGIADAYLGQFPGSKNLAVYVLPAEGFSGRQVSIPLGIRLNQANEEAVSVFAINQGSAATIREKGLQIFGASAEKA